MQKPGSAAQPGRKGRIPLSVACLAMGLASASPAWPQAQPAAPPPPQLEIGVGLARTPGWLGDDRSVTHGLVWVNAEYTTRAFGRFQVNGGTLTMDPSLNWDPWVKGIASAGPMVGYHGNATLGEDHSPRRSGSAAGLDAGFQVIVPMFGAPLFAQVRKCLAADQGWIVVVGSYLPLHPTPALTLAFLPTARWVDKKQSGSYFTPPAGTAADAGFQDVALEVALDWQFSRHVHWVNSASRRWLTGPAAKSPLTVSTAQRAFTSGLSYHF